MLVSRVRFIQHFFLVALDIQKLSVEYIGTSRHQVGHAMDEVDRYRFVVAVLLRRLGYCPLVDQCTKASEPLEDCQPLDTRLHLANEEDSKYQNNGGGRRGAA